MSNNTDNNMQEIKPDIFDKIMHLPGLRVFEPLYKKYKEVLLYLFFGVLTTVVSIGSYAFFNVTLGINELIANVISLVLAVLFAFFTNRIWDDLRLCRRILLRNRIYGDGQHPGNRNHVDPCAGDYQSRHQRKTAGECYVQGRNSPSHR